MKPLQSRAFAFALILAVPASAATSPKNQSAPTGVMSVSGMVQADFNAHPEQARLRLAGNLAHFLWDHPGYFTPGYKEKVTYPIFKQGIEGAVVARKDQSHYVDLAFVLESGMIPRLTGKMLADVKSDGAGKLPKFAGENWNVLAASYVEHAGIHATELRQAVSAKKAIKDVKEHQQSSETVVQGRESSDESIQPRISGKSPYDMEGLYFRGGTKPTDVWWDKDKDAKGKPAAKPVFVIKMFTRKTEDGKGTVDEVGICNVSHKDDLVWRHFPINRQGGTSTFQFDDRPGSLAPQYTLTMTRGENGDINITFGRPKAKPEQGITTTLSALQAARAQQAIDEGTRIKIPAKTGKSYIVIGQGANLGGHIIFEETANGVNLTPVAVGYTCQQKDGTCEKLPKPDLGLIDGKPYHLEFVPADAKHPKGSWKVVAGAGTPPPPLDPVPATTGGLGGSDVAANGNSGGSTAKAARGAHRHSAKESDFDAIAKGFPAIRDGNYEPYSEATKGANGQVRIYKITKKGEDAIKGDPEAYSKRYLMIFAAPNDKHAMQVKFLCDTPCTGYKDHEKISVLGGRYLVTSTDYGVEYSDLDDIGDGNYPKLAGQVISEKKVFARVTNDVVLRDAAGKVGFNAGDIGQLFRNIAQTRPNEGLARMYNGTGAFGNKDGSVTVAYGESGKGGVFAVWPSTAKEEVSGLKGAKPFTGFKFDQPVSNGPFDKGFKDPYDFTPSGRSLEHLTSAAKADDAILYQNDGAGTADKPQIWYFSYAFMNGTEKERSNPQPVFGKGTRDVVPYPTTNVQVAGLLNVDVSKANLVTKVDLRLVGHHFNQDRGAYAIFATPSDSPTSKTKNCVAPVIWWGMSQGDALAACQKDKPIEGAK